MGLGFTFALVVLGTIRELLGAGKILGFPILPQAYQDSPMLVAILAPGAFITLGFILAVINLLNKRGK
jgi:electron transport complex protein RnfE